jgi:hypothetical protein
MTPLPDTFALFRTDNDRLQIVSPDSWSLAAGQTFERRELRAADMAPARRPCEVKPKQQKLRRCVPRMPAA